MEKLVESLQVIEKTLGATSPVAVAARAELAAAKAAKRDSLQPWQLYKEDQQQLDKKSRQLASARDQGANLLEQLKAIQEKVQQNAEHTAGLEVEVAALKEKCSKPPPDSTAGSMPGLGDTSTMPPGLAALAEKIKLLHAEFSEGLKAHKDSLAPTQQQEQHDEHEDMEVDAAAAEAEVDRLSQAAYPDFDKLPEAEQACIKKRMADARASSPPLKKSRPSG